MAEHRTNTSFLIGLAVSACAHIAALFGLQHVRIEPSRTHISLASLKPLTELPHQARLPEQPTPPPDPAQQPPPPPPQPRDIDRDVKFGIDDSTIDSKTWLGFLEGDTPTGRKGDTDQAAMALDPGDPGAASPGSAGSPEAKPIAPAPESAQQPAASPPVNALNLKPPTPAPANQPPEESPPRKAEEAAPAPSRAAPPLAAPPVGEQGEKTEERDPLAPQAGTERATEGKRPDAPKPVEQPKDMGAIDNKPEKPDSKEGEEREGEARDTDSEKMSSEDGKGEAEKEVKEVVEATPLAKPEEAVPPVAVAPAPEAPPQQDAPSSQPTPASSAPSSSPPTPATGGQSKQKGIRSDRESEAFTKQVIDTPMRDGRVQAGRGLNIITRRADFTNTTLLTAPPRDTMIRISFQKSGKVKRAEFVNGSATGNPNVDDPLMNAIYRWRASGKDLQALGVEETLSVVVRVTFK